MAEEMWLLEAQPYDPVTAGVVNVYLAKRTTFFDANDATAPNRTYRGWLKQALTVTRAMFGLALVGGPSSPSYGAVELTVGDEFAAKRALYKRYRWAGRGVQSYRGTVGAARSTYTKLFDGVASAQPAFEKMRMSLPISDLQFKLDQPFQPATYAGGGGLDGGDDLKGRNKQDFVGLNRGVGVVWVDQTNGWADVCASGFDDVLAVRDGANALTADPSNPPAAGKYYRDDANGRLRFGSLPTFGYTVDFVSAFAGGAVTIGAIAKEIFTARAGFSGGQIDGDAFDDLDAARPETAGWGCPNGESCRALLDALLGGALCYYTTTPAQVTVGQLTAATETAKTDATIAAVFTDKDIVPGSFNRAETPAPPHTINIKARRNWTPLTDDQIAAAASQADRDFAREEWRTIPKPNATTASEFPQSLPLDFQTPFDDLNEASDFGDEVAALLTVPRPPAEVTLAIAPFGLQVGAHIWIESAVNEVDAPAVAASIGDNENSNRVQLSLFGLAE